MDPIGLTIGIAGLASIFTSCVDCFEYVQLGRKFGEDYGKCVLRLDAAKVRMTRWGASMGLGPELQHHRNQQISISEEEFHLARSLLEQIMSSFEDAEKLSGRYEKHATLQKTQTEDLVVYNTRTDLEPQYLRLHQTMRELALRRQHGTSILKKTTWALYEKKRFNTLIEDVTGFVTQLVELFPVLQKDQAALCETEVSAIEETEDLTLLRRIAGDDDSVLTTAVNEEIDRRGHTVTDWKASGNAKMWAGDDNAFGVESKGHHFSAFSVSGSADVRLGNINRGR